MSYRVAYFSCEMKTVEDAFGEVTLPDVDFRYYGYECKLDNGDGTFCCRFIIDPDETDTTGADSLDTPPDGVEDSVVMGLNDG